MKLDKILITGCNGLLGQKLLFELNTHFELAGCDLHDSSFLDNETFDYHRVDIMKRKALNDFIQNLKPGVIVNTAAYTNVDKAEIERERCWRVNVTGVENLISSAKRIDAQLIQISTDYIFDGKNGPYREDDRANPEGFYAKSKLAAENLIRGSDLKYTIIRTMVLYGAGVHVRPNFVTWLIQALRNRQSVTIVDDQIGNPTLADDLAQAIATIIKKNAHGIYHISGSEIIDRYHFALEIADIFNLEKSLIMRAKTSDLQQKAPRPLKSGFILDKAKTELGIEMRDVKSALKKFKKQFEGK